MIERAVSAEGEMGIDADRSLPRRGVRVIGEDDGVAGRGVPFPAL